MLQKPVALKMKMREYAHESKSIDSQMVELGSIVIPNLAECKSSRETCCIGKTSKKEIELTSKSEGSTFWRKRRSVGIIGNITAVQHGARLITNQCERSWGVTSSILIYILCLS